MIDAITLSLPLTAPRSFVTYDARVAAPALPAVAADELSDDDLEQVVGGLARVWTARPAATLPSA